MAEADVADGDINMTDEHRKEHQLIAGALREDWLHHSMLLVHMARFHDHRVKDVSNAGSAMLLVWHEHAHGYRVFEDAEKSLSAAFQKALASMRSAG